MIVRYTSPALADLTSILEDIARHSPQGAARVAARIAATERLIEQFPLLGRQTRLPGLRRMNVGSYPYFILYDVAGDEILIQTVRHTARRPLI